MYYIQQTLGIHGYIFHWGEKDNSQNNELHRPLDGDNYFGEH